MFAGLTFIKLSDASNPTLPPQKLLDRALPQLVLAPIRGCLPPPLTLECVLSVKMTPQRKIYNVKRAVLEKITIFYKIW